MIQPLRLAWNFHTSLSCCIFPFFRSKISNSIFAGRETLSDIYSYFDVRIQLAMQGQMFGNDECCQRKKSNG